MAFDDRNRRDYNRYSEQDYDERNRRFNRDYNYNDDDYDRERDEHSSGSRFNSGNYGNSRYDYDNIGGTRSTQGQFGSNYGFGQVDYGRGNESRYGRFGAGTTFRGYNTPRSYNTEYDRGNYDFNEENPGSTYGSNEYRRGYGGSYNKGSIDYNRYGTNRYANTDYNSDRGYGGYGGSYNDYYNNRRSRDYRNENYDRSRSQYRGEDRGWWDRTSDEIASWFGDEDAERRRDMDRIRAEHRGKGPKGYKRSDDRIREDINDRLSDDALIDATEVDVTVSGSEVTLTGTVDSRYAKRRAEDIADSVSGVTHVENRLRVNQYSHNTSQDSDQMGTGSSSSRSVSTKSKQTV